MISQFHGFMRLEKDKNNCQVPGGSSKGMWKMEVRRLKESLLSGKKIQNLELSRFG